MSIRTAMERFPRPMPAAATTCLLVMLVVSGCHRAADQAAEAAIRSTAGYDVEVNRNGDTTILRTDDGTEARIRSGNDLTLPTGFPDDIYLPGSYSLSNVTEVGPVTLVQLSSNDTVATLYAEADRTMLSEGWKQVMAMRQASGSAVLAYEKEKRRASFTLSGDASDGRTLVGVQLQEDG